MPWYRITLTAVRVGRRDLNLSRRRGHRNVFPVVDACGNRFLQRMDRTPQRLLTIFSKRRQFRKIRRSNKYSPTIFFKFNGIIKHYQILICDCLVAL